MARGRQIFKQLYNIKKRDVNRGILLPNLLPKTRLYRKNYSKKRAKNSVFCAILTRFGALNRS